MRYILFLIFIPVIVFAHPILDDFRKQGYHEFKNEYLGNDFFSNAYSAFDRLIAFMDSHPQWLLEQVAIDDAMVPGIALTYDQIKIQLPKF